MKEIKRCKWVTAAPLYQAYHDEEWGVPVFDEQKLFEFLLLEGAQAGLSWWTVLQKRENYRKLFANFAIAKIASFTPANIDQLLLQEGIIRNRLKLNAAVSNAQAVLALREEWGSLGRYLWHFVDYTPLQPQRRRHSEIPVRTEHSDRMAKALKKRGFSFVGSTICYALMQAVGMVNDHIQTCFRHQPLTVHRQFEE